MARAAVEEAATQEQGRRTEESRAKEYSMDLANSGKWENCKGEHRTIPGRRRGNKVLLSTVGQVERRYIAREKQR